MSLCESETENISNFFDDVLSKITNEDATDLRRMIKKFDQHVKRMKKNLSKVLARKTDENPRLNIDHVIENPNNNTDEENKEKRRKDAFYRRTVKVTRFEKIDDSPSAVNRCLNNLQQANLKFMFDSCEKFFIDSNSNIRLTYASRRQAIQILLEAKRTVRHLSNCHVNIECLVPPDKVDMKLKIKKKAMELKKEGLFRSFNIYESKSLGEWKMKLRVRRLGLAPNNVEDLFTSYSDECHGLFASFDDKTYFSFGEIFSNPSPPQPMTISDMERKFDALMNYMQRGFSDI